TFGDEEFWGDSLRLHQTIIGGKLGGVGQGLGPKAALDLGLKVDVEALPSAVRSQLRQGEGKLEGPARTILLLRRKSVVGLKAVWDTRNNVVSIGIQCALCHSTVDNSLSSGIGRRLDGWPNRDLNVGKIVSLAPNLKPIADVLGVDVATVKTVLTAWGPGK